MTRNVYVGWDSREIDAYKVCVGSLNQYSSEKTDIIPLMQDDLRERGLYARDDAGKCSTEFTYTRFLVPYLNNYQDWALFIDCDFLFTRDISELFNLADDKYALMCVQHDYTPNAKIKMDGQKQVVYPRKNWSSCMLWNCGHELNRQVKREWANTESGAFLHRFQWLPDDAIGSLPLEWNWLEGEYDKPDKMPAVVHYTNGGPWFENYQNVDYADEWKQAFEKFS
jgi:lipopolysaccharide biosynthesis glycosyltransferase